MAIVNHKDTEYALLEVTDDGILLVNYKKGVLVDEQVARHILEVHKAICAERMPCPVLVFTDQIKGMTKGARRFFAHDDILASTERVAILVASPIGRVIGNFFLGPNKTAVPVRLFTSEDKAMDWLRAPLG